MILPVALPIISNLTGIMHQQRPQPHKVGMPILHLKVIHFFGLVKKIMLFYALPLVVLCFYMVGGGQVGL
nr:hypothetical protein [Capnocytophaga canimorsus]